MSLESGTYIDDLDATNPPTTDPKSQGDDHIRLIKNVLKNTFPNANKPFKFPDADGGTDSDVVFDDQVDNFTYFADTSGGSVTIHLPSLDGSRYGLTCYIVKTTTDRNPMFVVSAGNNIFTGEYGPYAKIRRGFPNVRYALFWDGSNWRCPRHCGVPLGGLIPLAISYEGSEAPPVGYEWPNGQTLSTTDYPEYADQREDGSTPDLKGRVVAGRDNMGGSSADRLNDFDGDVFENADGSEYITLTPGQMPRHSHDGTTGDESQGHTHPYDQWGGAAQKPASAGTAPPTSLSTGNTGQNNQGHVHPFTTNDAGNDEGHFNIQPTIVENYVLVVE